MTRVNIQEARAHFSRYIERAVQGEVIIVCRHNQPVAELRAVTSQPLHPTRTAGLLKGQIQWEPGAFDPLSDEELAEFDGSPILPR